MKKLFLDTNFLLDYLVRDEYKVYSQEFLADAVKLKYKFYVSYLSVANFAYIERKLPQELLNGYLNTIIDIFEIVPNTKKQIKEALIVTGSDFEDVLQYQAAITAKCDCIISRNEKDFSFSKIPVLSASTFREKYF